MECETGSGFRVCSAVSSNTNGNSGWQGNHRTGGVFPVHRFKGLQSIRGKPGSVLMGNRGKPELEWRCENDDVTSNKTVCHSVDGLRIYIEKAALLLQSGLVREKRLELSRLWLDTGTSSLPVYLFQHSRTSKASVIISCLCEMSITIFQKSRIIGTAFHRRGKAPCGRTDRRPACSPAGECAPPR